MQWTIPTFSRSAPRGQPLRFQGVKSTRLLQGRLLVPGEYLQLALRYERNPYVGKAPPLLQEAMAGCVAKPQKILDDLAVELRRDPPKVRQNVIYELGSQVVLRVLYRSQGEDGLVYRLKIGGQTYAFKIFKEGSDPYEEVANGVYLTARRTRDVSRFYMANPVKGWMLTEYIDKNTKLADRSGRTMEEQGFESDDDSHAPNRINGILVDYGGELCVPHGYMSQGTFEEKLKEMGLLK